MQRNNLETFANNRSGPSPLQPSVQKKKKEKKKEKIMKPHRILEERSKSFLAWFLTLLFVSEHFEEDIFNLSAKQGNENILSVLVKNSGKCNMLLKHVILRLWKKYTVLK